MPKELWTVTAVVHHDDGGVTLTMTNENGNTKTENYPAGATVLKVVRK